MDESSKVNVDEEMDLASAFRVSGIPMLVVMKDGHVTNTAVGVRPKEQIIRMLGEGKENGII